MCPAAPLPYPLLTHAHTYLLSLPLCPSGLLIVLQIHQANLTSEPLHCALLCQVLSPPGIHMACSLLCTSGLQMPYWRSFPRSFILQHTLSHFHCLIFFHIIVHHMTCIYSFFLSVETHRRSSGRAGISTVVVPKLKIACGSVKIWPTNEWK